MKKEKKTGKRKQDPTKVVTMNDRRETVTEKTREIGVSGHLTISSLR